MKTIGTMTAALLILLGASRSEAGDAREDVVRKLGAMKVSVDFADVPLPEAVDYLRDVTGLNLVVLPRAMEKDGESKVRLKVKDLPVKSVLKLLLAPRGLTATIRDGAVVVLPREDLQDSTMMKMFDVRALQVKIQDFPGPLVELAPPSAKKVDFQFSFTEPVSPVSDEFLMDMIRQNTGNGSWESNPRAAINLNNGMLVVNQTPSVLKEIESLLGLLGQYQ